MSGPTIAALLGVLLVTAVALVATVRLLFVRLRGLTAALRGLQAALDPGLELLSREAESAAHQLDAIRDRTAR